MASLEQAIALKDEGNMAFKSQDWLKAIALYTKAIETNGSEASFYTNRAQVRSRVALTRRLDAG